MLQFIIKILKLSIVFSSFLNLIFWFFLNFLDKEKIKLPLSNTAKIMILLHVQQDKTHHGVFIEQINKNIVKMVFLHWWNHYFN